MKTPQSSDQEELRTKELRQDAEELLGNGDAVAWEPTERDLWIPYRVRGSWRGGVLG
jgi:hypothetical protein